jgi:hypothetical protein
VNEVWKPVPSLPGVVASSLGRIRLPQVTYEMPNGGMRVTTPTERLGEVRTAARDASCKYRAIYARKFGNIKVHRAVCEAFHGSSPSPSHVVLHLDENGLNNRPENLRWGTRKENQNAPSFKAWAAATCRAKMAGVTGMRKGH